MACLSVWNARWLRPDTSSSWGALHESKGLCHTVPIGERPCSGELRHRIFLSSPGLQPRSNRVPQLQAIADYNTQAGAKLVEDHGAAGAQKVEYNWETEWYPMYLQKELPTDAPLGLTVFDRSLVLYYDGKGVLNCLEDRCPHRAAKLSEGQIADGRLECLYHGWQFEGDGSCAKIPQLPAGAKIPRAACARSYAVQESQGVIWVWLGDKDSADAKKIPWFEHYATEGFQHISTIHELPYDYSILLENLMDPAHIPISHDRTDISAKREDAQALLFEVTERTARGFAGKWGPSKLGPQLSSTTRFEAPCVLRNDKEVTGKDGQKSSYSALFLCRPAGQGRSMLILRFGFPRSSSAGLQSAIVKLMPPWLFHGTQNTVFEQDMGFLSSQNEVLARKGVAAKDLYIVLQSSDTWVLELRKWMDLVGHGMPYYIGHRTASPAPAPAVLEYAPVGPVAATASSYPTKGSFGHLYARDLTNRYFRHVIHCKECRNALANFRKYQEVSLIGGVVSASVAILAGSGVWSTSLVALALVLFATSWGCKNAQGLFTVNFVRQHRK